MHNNEFKVFLSAFLSFFNSFLPVIFWILLVFGFDEGYVAGLTVISAIIHESGHYLYLALRGNRVFIKGKVDGFRIKGHHTLSYKDELFLAISGPSANLLIGVLSFLLSFPTFVFSDYLKIFGIINLTTAISNLLPIESYDGYRIVTCILLITDSPQWTYALLDKLSQLIVTFMILLSLYLMYELDGGYFIFLIFALSLYRNVSRNLNSTFFEN